MAKSGPRRQRQKRRRQRKLSVMVIHRIKDAMALASSVEAHKARLAAALGEQYSPQLLPGEELPDYVLALELAVRHVQTALRELIRHDDAVDIASAKYEILRREQNLLVRDEAYPCTVHVRGLIDLTFGRSKGAWVHGMKGRTRRSASPLRLQLERMVALLTGPDLQLPPPKNPHGVVDLEGWIRQLQPLSRKLVALNGEVVRRRDHALPALIGEKNAAMEAFDAAYRNALRQVAAAFAGAGLPAKVLKNLKPYYQRRRLERQARAKRRARAAASGAEAPEEVVPSPDRDTERVIVPDPILEWLESHRMYGT